MQNLNGCRHALITSSFTSSLYVFSQLSQLIVSRYACDKKVQCYVFTAFLNPLTTKNYNFYFLITYGICKKRKYCNHMSEKQNSLLLTNIHDLYVLEDKESKKKFPSVCLSGCLDVRTYVDFSWEHNNYRRS